MGDIRIRSSNKYNKYRIINGLTMDISSTIQMMAAALDRNTSAYTDQMREMKDLYGKADAKKRKRNDLFNRERMALMKKERENAEALYKTLIKAKAELQTSKGITESTAKSVRDLASDVDKFGDGARRSLNHLRSGTTNTTKSLDNLIQHAEDAANVEHKKVLAEERSIVSTTKFKDSMYTAGRKVREFATVTSGAAITVGGIIRSLDELDTSMKRQSGMYSTLNASIEGSAMSLHMAPAAMQAVAGDFRQELLALAGEGKTLRDTIGMMDRAFDTSIAGQEALTDTAYKLTGDYGEGLRLLMTNVQMFKKQGITGDLQSLSKQAGSLMKTFGRLSRLTGEESTALQAKIQHHLESASVAEELNRLDTKGRMAKIKEIAASVEMQVTMGKTVDAALAANEALSSLSGLDPKARLKEAAKLQAVSGAMGIQGGAKAAEIMRMSPQARKGEDNEYLTKFLGKLDEVANKRIGSDNFGLAQSTATMIGQLSDSTRSIMKESNMSKARGNAITGVSDKVAEPQLAGLEGFLQGGKQFFEKWLKPVVDDPAVNILGGILTGITGMAQNILTMALLSKLGFGLPNIIGGVKTAVGVLGTTLMAPLVTIAKSTTAMMMKSGGMMGKMGKAGAILSSGARMAGGVAAAGAAGYGAGTMVMKGLERFAPEAYSDVMVDGVGRGVAYAVDSVSSAFDSVSKWWDGDSAKKTEENDNITKALDTMNTNMEQISKNTATTADQATKTADNTKTTVKKVEEQTMQDVHIAEEMTLEERKGYRLQMIRMPGRSTLMAR